MERGRSASVSNLIQDCQTTVRGRSATISNIIQNSAVSQKIMNFPAAACVIKQVTLLTNKQVPGIEMKLLRSVN